MFLSYVVTLLVVGSWSVRFKCGSCWAIIRAIEFRGSHDVSWFYSYNPTQSDINRCASPRSCPTEGPDPLKTLFLW